MTQADLASNKFITDSIKKISPNIPILSEEEFVEWDIRKKWKAEMCFYNSLPYFQLPLQKLLKKIKDQNTLRPSRRAIDEIINFNKVYRSSFNEDINFKMTVEHGIKESSSEIFLSAVSKNENTNIDFDQEEMQSFLEDIVNYIADSVGTFSGTSLAAQSLNDRKKSRIFSENERTVIELDLSFERAWSTVSRAINASKIISNDRNREDGIFYVSLTVEDQSSISRFNPLSFFRNNPSEQVADPEYMIFVTRFGSKTLIKAEAMSGSLEDAEELISVLNESLS